MDDINPIIYGLESQARALSAQLAESQDIRFFIATQSLKPKANQLHLIELNEDATAIRTATVFAHPAGEVWRLNSSPFDPRSLVSCYSTQKGTQVLMQSAIVRLPAADELDAAAATSSKEYHPLASTEVLDTAAYGNDIRTTEFHPSNPKWLATVVDGRVLLHERTGPQTRVVAEMTAKGQAPRFGTGKWSQHHQGNQFVVLYENGMRSFDVRDANHVAWSLDEAHGQQIRDLDCNPNKQCHLATAGDDGQLKVWDSRNLKEALFVRNDHSHWIWSVRFNTFHDQLILTSSSDCKVLLTCAGSVSSEANDDQQDQQDQQRDRIADGLLETFDQHEDSVYCVEWSSVDPWVFASLSYDGRVIISKVPKQYKYKILL